MRCIHYWLCDSPDPERPRNVPARCAKCGKERVFNNRTTTAPEFSMHFHRQPQPHEAWAEAF